MKRQEDTRLWRDVNILCQLIGHLLSDLGKRGGFVGRVMYVENYAPFVPDTFCGWADARVKYADVWKQYWSDSVLPRSKRDDIEKYVRKLMEADAAGEISELPPIMVCIYDDGAVTVDGGRRCSALMKLEPEERERVVMPAFIIDLRKSEREREEDAERELRRKGESFVELFGGGNPPSR